MNVRGFTLAELVLVILILGILGAVGTVFLRAPVDAWQDQLRRSELVESGEVTLRRMAADARRALPNSVRTGLDVGGCPPGAQCLEMLQVVAVGRYRDAPAAGGGPPGGGPPGGGPPGGGPPGGAGAGDPDKRLEFDGPDDSFNVQGPFPTFPGGTTQHYLVICNLGSGDANAYDVTGADGNSSEGIITPRGTRITIFEDTGTFEGERTVVLESGHGFRHESPGNRIYLVEGGVMYQCRDGALWRFTGYDFGPAMPNLDPALDGGQLVARHIAGCAFHLEPGHSIRAALLSMEIVLEREGEGSTLLHQVQVENRL